MSTHEHESERALEGDTRDNAQDAAEQSDTRRATTLDLPPDELRALARVFYDIALGYIESPDALPVFPETSAEAVAKIFRTSLPADGVGLADIERDCAEIIRNSRQNGHPRMFGYVASPASPVGAFASMLASALNANVTSWRSAPAATEVERTVVRWIEEMIGYASEGRNAGCGGLLTSGGSMANLNALFVAHRTKASELARGKLQDVSKDGALDTPGDNAYDASREGLWMAGAPMTVYASDQI